MWRDRVPSREAALVVRRHPDCTLWVIALIPLDGHYSRTLLKVERLSLVNTYRTRTTRALRLCRRVLQVRAGSGRFPLVS